MLDPYQSFMSTVSIVILHILWNLHEVNTYGPKKKMKLLLPRVDFPIANI